ncbi:MAG TPA: helix-turn-helix domain-containing protein, partial [Phycisphaerales bacterium]|nr:helix-turn-helix domain-containing protein [Phycisphaerales bacterium]
MKLHEATAPTNLTGPLRLARLINEARTLTGPEKDLLRAMMQWINPQTLCLHPSVKRLAAAIGKSDRTVQRLLNGLADKGAISIERRSGGSPLATNKVRWNPSAWQSEEPTLFGSIAPEAGGGQENTGDTHVTGLSMSPVTPVSLTGDTHVTRTSKRTSKQQQGGTPPPP